MGFSVSGATALLFIAFLISFGAFYTASTGAVDQVQEAQVDQTERNIETLNTEIEIDGDGSSYNTTSNNLEIVANNTGASSLQVADLSLLVNGEYVSFDPAANATLSDPAGDTLWIPQQRLTITVSGEFETPVSIKLVTEYGIAAMEEVG